MKPAKNKEPLTGPDIRVRILVGQRIQELRTNRMLKLKEAAERAGIYAASLSNIEAGKRSTSIIMLNLICKALGITLKEFFNNERFNSKI